MYILTAEAKDLYNANHLVNESGYGYNIRTKAGNINVKKFINALDYSLDLIKLREIYEKIYRRHDFSFTINRKEYTKHVINVKFSYAHKEFNKAGNNIYIRNGYQYKDIQMQDHICVIDDKLIGIEVDTEVNEPYKNLSILEDYFVYEDGKYKNIKNNVVLNKSELRQELYTNGFICDGIKYVRWKRSSGSSRVGKCLFINEALYQRMHKWETCNLKINNGDPIDLAAFEAYISLTSSSIIDTIEIKPENFLVVDDYESVFKDIVVGVEFEGGHLVSKTQEYEISNSIFDGESLIDESLVPDKYKHFGMLLLRNRFFKSASFNCNIQKWFKDNNITNVDQLNGFTLARDISEVKIITTPSSIKYCKFGTIQQWLELIEPTFGIVKHEKPTHYFDGRMVSCHYQLINTLQLTEKDVQELLQPSFDYITQVRNDPAILRYHIDYPYKEMPLTPINSKNEIIFKLLGINENFAKTSLYYEFRDDLIRSMIRELKQGHVLINGNYSTLLGNGLEMLQHSIGRFRGESVIGTGNIHSERFEYGKTILGSRSPHICAGNVLVVQNVENEEIDKYFNLSNEVVYVNAIGENIQQRLDGADYDSDTLLLTDNRLLVERAVKNYHIFKVPTCLVEAKKIKRFYTNEQKADLDVKTSVNKIGEIVNLSQQLNSLYWQNINKGQNFDENIELYEDICKLAALSNIEIDKAKKEYAVDSGAELNFLKEKYKIIDKGKVVKPMFFKMITLENGYKLNEKHLYKYFKTPMDYLQKNVASFQFRQGREQKLEVLPFSSIVTYRKIEGKGKCYYEYRDRIINIVEDTNKELNKLYIGYDMKTKEEKEEIQTLAADVKQECVEYINNLSISEITMYLLLTVLDKKEYHHVRRRIFETLFGTPNQTFFKMISECKKDIQKVMECDNGDIKLYNYSFKKTPLI